MRVLSRNRGLESQRSSPNIMTEMMSVVKIIPSPPLILLMKVESLCVSVVASELDNWSVFLDNRGNFREIAIQPTVCR